MRNMFFQLTSFLLLLLMFTFSLGCSGGGNPDPIVPAEPERETLGGSHCTWGLWQFVADPTNETLDVIQLRSGNMHLNALPFLEPPPSVYLSVANVHISGNVIDCDVSLRHPFLGMVQYSGFDVCGVLISKGSLSGFNDPDIMMAGEGDTRLLNADGYTRWWNPAEFPMDGTMFAYQDGLLGTPDSAVDFNCTINGYKYYADALQPDDPIQDIVWSIDDRGMFSAGQKNTRHYKIELGSDGLVFNYAVDANWKFPTGNPPYQAPDDFSEGANRPEAFMISVIETTNTLHPGGGSLGLEIAVFDWFGAESCEVTIETPGIIGYTTESNPDAIFEHCAVFNIGTHDCNPLTVGEIDVLVSVVNDSIGYGGLLPGEPVTSYFIHETTVIEDIPVEYNLVLTIERNSNDLITGIELDWDDTSGISEYNIYRQDPFDDTDDWAKLPASPVGTSDYVDNDIVGNEAYQYKVIALVGTNEVSDTSVEAYAILENAEDNVNTDCVWETCAFPIMYNANNLPWSLFCEFAPLNQTPQNGTYCWDESGLQNGPGTPGSYWTGSASLFATPILPIPEGAENCQADFCVRLNNMWPWWDGNHCGTIVGVTNVVEDGPDNPFWPSQEYIEGLDYNVEHVQGFSMYEPLYGIDNFTNVDETNDKGHGVQYPGYQDIAYAYSKFSLPDVFTIPDARAAFAWACGNSAGGTAIPNVGTSFDDIAIIVY